MQNLEEMIRNLCEKDQEMVRLAFLYGMQVGYQNALRGEELPAEYLNDGRD